MVKDCNRPKCHFLAISLASQLQREEVKALQGRVEGFFVCLVGWFFCGGWGDDFRFSAPS